MRLKPALVVLVALMCSVLLVGGCSSGEQNSASSNKSSLSNDQIKIVVDAYGRSVKIPSHVETAATVGSAARIVVNAGGQDKLIAIGELDKVENALSPYAVAAAEIFRDLPTTNSGSNHLVAKDIDTEKLIELDPDVIISSSSADACDALQEATGIPVVGVFYQNQLFTANVINSIECVGETLGTESHAQEVIAKLQIWQEDLSNRTEKYAMEARPLVYFGGVAHFEGHNWYGTYANYAPAIATHVRSMADELASDGYVEVTLDELVDFDPDYMFINNLDVNEMLEAYYQNTAAFNGLKAVKNGNVYTQPYFNFNGTGVATGICNAYFVGSTVYPESFSDVNLEALYTDIYETMLDGFDFYTYMKTQGLYFGKFPTL